MPHYWWWFGGLPVDFHKYFGGWLRIEPRCRSNDFSRGLQARIADPLWMLGRQWQTGEFQAEDAGSPIKVSLAHSTQTVDHVHRGEAKVSVNLHEVPLELVVEQEALKLDWRSRAQMGQQFERFITQAELGAAAPAVINEFRISCPFKLPFGEELIKIDRATRRFVELMAGRVIDVDALLTKLGQHDLTLPDGIPAEQLDDIISRLEVWRGKLHSQPPAGSSTAWHNEQLHYQFELDPPEEPPATDAPSPGPPAKTHLVASEYRNGELDWYTFSTKGPLGEDWTAHPAIETLPTQISVAGNSLRWWAFEDSAVDFGKLDVAKPDLAKLLIMEFALIYADDWFSVPLPVRMANLVRIDELKIVDTFGIETISQQARSPKPGEAGGAANDPLLRWEMFSLARREDPEGPGMENVLFVPPVAGFREESPPVEEVWFLRDEGANMVWGVERSVPNGLGNPVHGFEAQRELHDRENDVKVEPLEQQVRQLEQELTKPGLSDDDRKDLQAQIDALREEIDAIRNGPPPIVNPAPRYRLASTVPENWIPFLPVNANARLGLTANYANVSLHRAKMLRNEAGENPVEIKPMSRILELDEDPLLWLDEATVPRSGLRVQLTAQRLRWVDGKTYVWYGRKVLTGRGEGSSGLKFDIFNGSRGS